MFKKEYEKYQITTRSLKYDFDEIPDDYFTNDMQLIKDFFYMYFEEIGDIKYTFEDLELHYDISLEHIENKLLNDGLIKCNSENKLEITQKGIEFYDTIKNKYDIFLDCTDGFFYFSEYYDYCLKNPDKSDEENLLGFLDLHYDLAIEREDFNQLYQYYDSIGYFYNVFEEDFEKGLTAILKLFILSLNPVFLPKEFYKLYEPISYSININLVLLSEKLSKEYILNRFDKIWDEWSLDKTFTSKKKCLEYLEKLLKSKNAYEKLNKKIKIK